MKHLHTTVVLLVAGTVLCGCAQPPAANLPVANLTAAQSTEPQRYEVRKAVAEEEPESTLEGASEAAVAVAAGTSAPAPVPAIPPVYLTTEHAAMCRVRVGDHLPEIKLNQLSGGSVDLASLQGEQATVVLFWHPDRWMSQTALRDLEREVGQAWPEKQVQVLGIAVETSPSDLRHQTKVAGAKFPQLLDAEGKAFDRVGLVNLPRVYVLNAAGEIVWFDLEYSESTRRELHNTLLFLTAQELK